MVSYCTYVFVSFVSSSLPLPQVFLLLLCQFWLLHAASSFLHHARGLGDILDRECSRHWDCSSDGDAGVMSKGVVCDTRMGRCRCRRHFYSYRDEQCVPGEGA